MMKTAIFITFLLFSALGFSQTAGDFTLNWTDGVVSSVGDVTVVLPQFQQEYFTYDPNDKQVKFAMSSAATAMADENSLKITNVVYESISRAQLGDIDVSKLPVNLNPDIYTFKARQDFYTVIKLNPILKEGNSYKRLKSFHYTYNINAARSALRTNSGFNSIYNSVLASGSWYRFYVEKSGVYKLSKGFLQSLGFNTNVDPRSIKIYGNGGRMAPLLNATDYPADLKENAIRFIGEEDGTFNSGDYILFYAEGVDNWNDESGTHNNLYANRSYYYVTAGSTPGKRIQTQAQPESTPSLNVSTFDDYQFHEQDLVNVARLGRKWQGEAFNVENEQAFDFTVPDIDTSVPVKVTVTAAANSVSSTSMTVKANGSDIGVLNFNPPGDSNNAFDARVSNTFSAAGSAITVNLTYNNNGVPGSNAWLDYIIIEAKRQLKGNNKQFRFRYNDAAANLGVIQYNFSNASGINEVWDITDIYNAESISNEGNQAAFSFKAPMGELRQYIAVVPNDYYEPLREQNTKVANQNIKGTIFNNAQGQFQDLDFIIITPKFLHASAETLANLHRSHEGLNVKVVDLENIYQEFSSGKQDIAGIRNFVKYVYNNASSPEKKLKYLCLFGDTSFDYKDRIPNNDNIVPSFHAYRTEFGSYNYSKINTFVSDDFFTLMDDNEGRMPFPVFEGPDIAVGRMLVNDVAQADEMVNKVSEYLNPESYGRWRNEYVVVSDDLDGAGSSGFVTAMDALAENINTHRPFVNVRKIYEDAWMQEASSGGQRYPEAKAELMRSINYGALVVNYLGHGGESGLASERLFETSDAQNLTNQYKYPLFVTATCQFTKFDNPYLPTAGEHTYWNPKGGAIAMITTTRELYISAANIFNRNLTSILYAFDQPASQYPTMGEALRLTKLTIADYNINVIAFIGDPALMLAIPKPNIVLTEINGVPVSQSQTVLNALAHVTLGGNVTDEANNILNNYNGNLEVTVFDKPIDKVTLANDTGSDSDKHPFTILGETIFRGNATVTNGHFEFDFIVPRDIRIPVAEGRVSFYAKKNNVLEDQTGYDNNILIGGINQNAEQDITPPTVRLYMNDESFVSGGITNASPMLLAYLEDAHGINTASGIGHDILGVLDGDETNQFIMNDYYEADENDYTRGKVRYPFINLEKGLHTLQFKAWDVYNNLVTAEIQFVVAGDDELKLDKVLNYPNPFVNYTEFWFNHNRPYEPLDVQVQIFTVTGKIVKTINQSVTTDGFLSRDIKWDGRDDFGDRIGKGVYIYKLTVCSTVTHKTAEKYEKLVLL